MGCLTVALPHQLLVLVTSPHHPPSTAVKHAQRAHSAQLEVLSASQQSLELDLQQLQHRLRQAEARGQRADVAPSNATMAAQPRTAQPCRWSCPDATKRPPPWSGRRIRRMARSAIGGPLEQRVYSKFGGVVRKCS